jgi:hypothetical protein
MHACTKQSRQKLAQSTGITESSIREWAIIANLMQVPGIAEKGAILLRRAGVSSLDELGRRHATTLFDELKAANEMEGLYRRLPSQRTLRRWIRGARMIDEIIP